MNREKTVLTSSKKLPFHTAGVVRTVFFTLFLTLACWGNLLAIVEEFSHGLKKDSFLRDAEIEDALKDFLNPIFKVADMDPKDLRIHLLYNPAVNAAATVEYRIFINTGLLLKTENVSELIGVLAHETGHIADGHVAKIMGASKNMTLASIAGTLLGLGVAAAGSVEGGTAILASSQGLAMSHFFHYHRGQESIADQLAIKYLTALHWPLSGFYTFMEKLKKQELLSIMSQDAYMRTHPFTAERLHAIEKGVKAQKASKLPDGFEEKFELIRAKTAAYLYPQRVLQGKIPIKSEVARAYALAISFYRLQKISESLEILDQLIVHHPKNPYFHEQKADILFREGKQDKALVSINEAVSLRPKSALLKLYRAQMLLESKEKIHYKKAMQDLIQVEKSEKENPFFWQLKAIAYGKLDNQPMMALALAEKALLSGETDLAERQANRALKIAKTAQVRQRANDILADIKNS